MSLLDSLKSLLSGPRPQEDSGYWIYVRCRRCGEPIRTRLDLRNALSQRDDGGYIMRKTLIGSGTCFERIEVTMTFDENRHLVQQEAIRGDFITAEEYEAARRAREESALAADETEPAPSEPEAPTPPES